VCQLNVDATDDGAIRRRPLDRRTIRAARPQRGHRGGQQCYPVSGLKLACAINRHCLPLRESTESRGAGPGVAGFPFTTPSIVARYRTMSTEPVCVAVTSEMENWVIVGRLSRYSAFGAAAAIGARKLEGR
jgi:hypothetical protein